MIDIDGYSEPISEKDVFKSVILYEFGPLKPVLCKFAVELLDKIPEYFWIVPASSSGKYHPKYSSNESGAGGLARHSLMTYAWLKSLLDTQTDSSIATIFEFIPSMIFASLFHDCCKLGLPDSSDQTHTVHEHPLYAAKFIIDQAEVFLMNNKEFIEMTSDDDESFRQDIATAVSCIETHMGKWTKNKNSTIELPLPKTSLQQMVHVADYCASRKFTEFDTKYFSDIFTS